MTRVAAFLACIALLAPAAAQAAPVGTPTTPQKQAAPAKKKDPFVGDQSPAPSVGKATPLPAADKVSLWDDLTNFALTWLPIIFMGLIVLLIGLTMRYMPRTKPQEIKPDTSQSIRWGD